MIRSQVVSFLAFPSSEGSADICKLEIVLAEEDDENELIFVVVNGFDGVVKPLVLVIHDKMRRGTMDDFIFVMRCK